MSRAPTTSRLPSDALVDDLVQPFQAERSGVMGRLVRLGPCVHEVLTRHEYPDAVSTVLGEALALAAMLGSTLEDGAKVILQTQTDGPLRFLVVNYEQPGGLRGYARFDRARIEAHTAAHGATASGKLLGKGHLGLTIDLGKPRTEPYQGIVALEGETLTEAALLYFQRSAQLPTFIRLAVAKHYAAPPGGTSSGRGPAPWTWRVGGLMIQNLSPERGDEFKGAHGQVPEDDDPWQRTQMLAATVEDHELLDPMLSPERLVYRLFHEEGVRVYRPQPLAMRCRCSRERVERMLVLFSETEMKDLVEEDGSVTVTCEFCRSAHALDKDELARLRAAAGRGSPGN